MNALCGVASIYFATQGRIETSLLLLLVGAAFDGLDGAAARKWGGTRFGVYSDDIADGINYAIAPGVVDGEHWDGVDAFFAKYEAKPLGQKKKEVGAAVPFGRMGTAEDLTGMAIFLATPEAKYIVAQCFGVDGGNWMA